MSYPKELTERKQWVNWRLIPDKDGGKDKKMPFNPVSGKGAASNNPATWTDYATAADAVERYGFTGRITWPMFRNWRTWGSSVWTRSIRTGIS